MTRRLLRRDGAAGRALEQGVPDSKPVAPDASWAATIEWRPERDKRRFRVVARSMADGREAVLARSRRLDWPPKSRAAVLRMTEALEDLESELVKAGWQAAPGTTNSYETYERRFAWTPAARTSLPALNGRRSPTPDDFGDVPVAKRAIGVVASTARARLALSALSLAALAGAAAAVAIGSHALRLACLLVFCVVGIGSAPWLRDVEMRLHARLALTLLTGLAVLTVVPMTMLAIHRWQPITAFLLVAAVCAPLHAAALRWAISDVRATQRARRPVLRGRPLTMVLAASGAACCLGAAVADRHIDPGFYGFLTQVSPVWYVGLALLLVALVSPRGDEDQEMAVPVVLLVLVLTLTPALMYGEPGAQSAAKHVDLVTQIRVLHGLVTQIDIYNDWGGFFASMAWLADIVGIRDPWPLATFWPVVTALFRVAALRFLFGQLLPTPRQCWIAVALAVLADSLGADYFSPQAFGFLIGLVVFGLALAPYDASVRLTLIFVAGCVLAMSHQLSPYLVGASLVVLVVFRQVRPWWTPLLVLGPAVFWALTHRNALAGFIALDVIGNVHNFRPPQTVAAPGLERFPVVGQTVRATLFAIGLVGALALVGLLRHWREARFWAMAVCPGAGLALCLLNAYGQEALFRATLFGLPWLAALAASWLSAPPRVATRLGALVVAAALTGAFLVARFGLDAIAVIRSADVAAVRYFRRQDAPHPATIHYMVYLGTGQLPGFLPARGSAYDLVDRNPPLLVVRQRAHPRPRGEVRGLTEKLIEYSDERPNEAKLYAIWSPVQADFAAAYGVESRDQSEGLRDAFARSSYWHTVFRQDGTVLFRFDPAGWRRLLAAG